MKPRILESLKEIAKRGGIKGFISLRTTDLADALKISQQSASNRLTELVKDGYVQRRWGPRSHQVMITKEGLLILTKEFEELKAIFTDLQQISFTGTLSDGIGEGKYYITQDGYQKQFKTKLGFVPKHGTFNIKLRPGDLQRLEYLKERSGIVIDGFDSKGRTFGKGKCFLAKIKDVECAVMIPNRSHYNDVLEVISDTCLRKSLGIGSGQKVTITIQL